MMMTRAVAIGAAAVALVTAVSACQNSSAGGATPTSSHTSAPTSPTTDPSSGTDPSPTTTPPQTSPAAEASAQAVALVPIYLKTIDDLFLDPTLSLNRLHNVTVSPEFLIEASGIAKFRGRDYRQIGKVRLVKTSVIRVSLVNRPRASPSPHWPTVWVTTCVDVSGVQAYDANGTSVLQPGRPDFVIQRLTVTNPQFPDRTGWRVSHAPNEQAASCDG
jgi:hypothetical protein